MPYLMILFGNLVSIGLVAAVLFGAVGPQLVPKYGPTCAAVYTWVLFLIAVAIYVLFAFFLVKKLHQPVKKHFISFVFAGKILRFPAD